MFFVFSYAKLLVYRLFIDCKVTCICHVDKYQVMMILLLQLDTIWYCKAFDTQLILQSH